MYATRTYFLIKTWYYNYLYILQLHSITLFHCILVNYPVIEIMYISPFSVRG